MISLFINSNSFSQKNYKFAHVDFQSILQVMPERAKAQEELQKFAEELQDQAEAMEVEYNNKLENYINSRDSLKKLIRETREAELQEMQNRIQQFRVSAQQELQAKESELFQPLMEKAQNAIQQVGKENGYIYVFDKNSLLFVSEQSDDVSSLVKEKLNITQ